MASGLLSEFAAAVREIDFRLTVEPHEWGESREFLKHLRVQLRCGTSRMVTVVPCPTVLSIEISPPWLWMIP